MGGKSPVSSWKDVFSVDSSKSDLSENLHSESLPPFLSCALHAQMCDFPASAIPRPSALIKE
jgi:hypothetical protein